MTDQEDLVVKESSDQGLKRIKNSRLYKKLIKNRVYNYVIILHKKTGRYGQRS